MAAESSNYFQIGAKFRGPNNVVMTINPAKAQWTYDQVKALFYLDGVIAFTANVGGITYHGFWGTCIVGGINETMHRSNRIINIYGSTLGQSKRIFNDSGLNTLGKTTAPPAVTNPDVETVNVGSFNSKSAYFVDGSYGLQFNNNNLGWINHEIGAQARNTALDTTTVNIADSLEWNDVTRVRSYHLNSEGIYVSSETNTFTVLAARLLMKYDASYASTAASLPGNGANKYYTVKGLSGGQLFNSADGQFIAPSGYYVANGRWYKVIDNNQSNLILQSGNAVDGQWPAGDPANYSQISWTTFSTTSQVNACTISSNPRTTYKDKSNNRHYSSLGGPVAANGWYCQGNNPFRFYYHIVDGYEVESGDCNPPT